MNQYYEKVAIKIAYEYPEYETFMLDYIKNEGIQFNTATMIITFIINKDNMDDITREVINEYCVNEKIKLDGDKVNIIELIKDFDSEENKIEELRQLNLRKRNIDLMIYILKHKKGFFGSKISKEIIEEFITSSRKLEMIRKQSLRFLIAATQFKSLLDIGGDEILIKAMVKHTNNYEMVMEMNRQNVGNYQFAFLNSILFTMPESN